MKVSIVTTCFNMKSTIRETIKSVLSQSGDFDLDYIVTDGGSNDGTVDIIKEYKDKLRWLSEKDNGQSDGINKGLRMAEGEIIAYLNADDIYYPGAIQNVVEFFKNNKGLKWVSGYCKIIDVHGVEIRKRITSYKIRKLRNYNFTKLLIENNISQPATFWKRELHKKVGYFSPEYHLCMDYDFWCRIGQKYPIGIIPQFIAGFRFYNTSKTGSMVLKHIEEHHRVTKKYTKDPWVLFRSQINNYKKLIGYKILRLIGR